MFCNKCGHQFEGNYCPKCGAKSKTAPADVVENTTVVTQVETEENPFDIYYNEPVDNASTNQPVEQDTYEPQFGYQPPMEDVQADNQPEFTDNTVPQWQQPYQNNQPTPPYQQQPPKQQPIYYPPHPPQPPKKPLTWWQTLLIVLVAILGYGIISGILPIACVCSMIACDEAYLYDYSPSTTIDEVCFPNQPVNSEYFSYTLTDATYIDEYAGSKPKEGYRFLEVKIESYNISKNSQWVDYELSCYIGDVMYDKVVADNYYYSSGELLPDKTYVDTCVFEIPENAETINLYLDDYYKNIKFIIQ